jgi:hypothetical protein
MSTGRRKGPASPTPPLLAALRDRPTGRASGMKGPEGIRVSQPSGFRRDETSDIALRAEECQFWEKPPDMMSSSTLLGSTGASRRKP